MNNLRVARLSGESGASKLGFVTVLAVATVLLGFVVLRYEASSPAENFRLSPASNADSSTDRLPLVAHATEPPKVPPLILGDPPRLPSDDAPRGAPVAPPK